VQQITALRSTTPASVISLCGISRFERLGRRQPDDWIEFGRLPISVYFYRTNQPTWPVKRWRCEWRCGSENTYVFGFVIGGTDAIS
jgi:hypothetical protein